MDIADFLAARYDEEQRLAEWAAKPHLGPQGPGDTAVWQVEEWVPSEHEEGAVPAAIWVTDRSEMGIGQMRPDRGIAAHIAYWDPARVLADIAAKRRHLEIWRESLDQMSEARRKGAAATGEMSKRAFAQQYDRALGAFDTICKVLNRDVATYAWHAEFDETWRLDD